MTRQLVQDVMNAAPVSVTTRTPFKDLVRIVVGNQVGAVPVLGRRGEIVGLVAEADLLKKQGLLADPEARRPVRRAYRARWSRAVGDCAGEVMTTRPVTVRLGATVAEAARLMERHHCTCLPVVNQHGQLAGMVGSRDLLQVFLRSDEQIKDDVTQTIEERRFAGEADTVTVDVADGLVTVTGVVKQKSMLPFVLASIRAVDGVVDVEGQLGYAVDDTRVPAA